MTQVFSPNGDSPTQLHPLSLLEQLSDLQADGCLQVYHRSVEWLIYFHQGKLTYATHSVAPFERLELHLRRLSHEVPTLTKEIRRQVQSNFKGQWYDHPTQCKDYQAIIWLVKQKHLKPIEAAKLIFRLTQEVIESYLLIPGIMQRNFIAIAADLPLFCSFDWQQFTERCQNRLQNWQSINSQVNSSYQRLYFFGNAYAKRTLSPPHQEQLGKVLKGLSLRHLAALFDQDELLLAKKLHPLIVNGAIILRDPQPPFNLLPKFSASLPINSRLKPTSNQTKQEFQNNSELGLIPNNLGNQKSSTKTWTIACVDDSKTILNELRRFLEHNFSVITINDPVTAPMKIIQIKPDLILLDIGMPNVDGYVLCSMLRKASLLKSIPIIMVTGKKGLIDRARAKLAGANDYITKPFTQSELLDMISRYLN